MIKIRHGGLKLFVQGHRTDKWPGRDTHGGDLIQSPFVDSQWEGMVWGEAFEEDSPA